VAFIFIKRNTNAPYKWGDKNYYDTRMEGKKRKGRGGERLVSEGHGDFQRKVAYTREFPSLRRKSYPSWRKEKL